MDPGYNSTEAKVLLEKANGDPQYKTQDSMSLRNFDVSSAITHSEHWQMAYRKTLTFVYRAKDIELYLWNSRVPGG